MTESEIQRLESRLTIRLPDEYRDFLLSYPRQLVEAKKELAWKRESPSERELINDANRLASLNDFIRLPDTPWTSDDGPWPRHYFVIGDDECGNYWCLDVRTPTTAVWFYDHDAGEFQQEYDSLHEFADALLVRAEQWNRERKDRDG
jgi:SMI1 / KNR4 family (SUKH-1)